MNTLRISPSAYIDGLILPELQAELVLAASRLVGTRVVASSISPQHVCRECAGRATERLAVLHTEDCTVGMVAHLLLAIAHAEAANVSPTHRKEPSQQQIRRSEPAEAAAEEKRPFLLPEPLAYSGETICPKGIMSARSAEAFREAWAAANGHPWTGENYGEPWTTSPSGDVLDCEGNLVVDAYGSGLVEPDEIKAGRRIVACVNHCKGVPTDALCRETERALAGGGR